MGALLVFILTYWASAKLGSHLWYGAIPYSHLAVKQGTK